MSRIKFPLQVLKPLKSYLIKEEGRLKKRQKDLEKEDPYNDQDRINDNAAADTEAAEEAGHDRISALKSEVERMLITIRKTLTKIKLGRYGLCEKCGRMIDTDRLAIDPTVTLCIDCANHKS